MIMRVHKCAHYLEHRHTSCMERQWYLSSTKKCFRGISITVYSTVVVVGGGGVGCGGGGGGGGSYFA